MNFENVVSDDLRFFFSVYFVISLKVQDAVLQISETLPGTFMKLLASSPTDCFVCFDSRKDT